MSDSDRAAQRRLTAIMMADIVGYSRLMASSERDTHARVQQLQRELIEPTIQEHRGRLLKVRGDGFLSMFDSPVECVRCAIVIQQTMVGKNLELPPERAIRFRIGINVGDVIVEHDDIYGDGVNVAARLEQLAEPGSINISGVVYEMVRYRLVCGYHPLGDTNLKNITDPVEIYRVLPDPASVAKLARGKVLRVTAAVIAGLVIVGALGGGGWYFWSSARPTIASVEPLARPVPVVQAPATPSPSPQPTPIPLAAPVAPPPAHIQEIVQPSQPVVAPPAPPIQEALVVIPPIPPEIMRPEMVPIAGGTFEMGSNDDATEKPIHKVTVGPFLLGKYPVTNQQWRECVTAKGCSFVPQGDDDAPIANISWLDAKQYVTWLSRETQQSWRLPSEAEWEFAARGGTTTRYWWGAAMKPGLAVCKGCGDASKPTKIGTRSPNPYGIYDINGGLTEWVEDCWFSDYRSAPANGAAREAPDCRERVLRGGAWTNDPSYVRLTSRDSYDASVRYPTHGVRIARSP